MEFDQSVFSVFEEDFDANHVAVQAKQVEKLFVQALVEGLVGLLLSIDGLIGRQRQVVDNQDLALIILQDFAGLQVLVQILLGENRGLLLLTSLNLLQLSQHCLLV